MKSYLARLKHSILALLGCLLLLTSCGQNGTASQTPTSSVVKADIQAATNVVAGAFSPPLHMINATIGWTTSWDIAGSGAYTILKTTDGGRHWKTMLKCLSTQDLGKGFFEECVTDFHSTSVATVIQPEYESKTQTSRIRIFHTSDGGQTWQSSVINARTEAMPVFVDGLHGWVLATDHFPGPDPSSDYIGGQIALYRTSDGGKTWQRIASGPSTPQIATTTDDAYGIPPFTATTRVQFVTPSTGWLSGIALRPDMSYYSWLYITHDGGSSWHKVDPSFPRQAATMWFPTFFTEQDALFSVLISSPVPQTILYTTHDGGHTWTNTTVPFDVTNATFIDMNHAVSAVASESNAFYTTNDGWKHWTKVQIQTTFKAIYAFDFVSPALGWALANNPPAHHAHEPGGGIRKGDVIALLQTTDGGRTWREIAHSVV